MIQMAVLIELNVNGVILRAGMVLVILTDRSHLEYLTTLLITLEYSSVVSPLEMRNRLVVSSCVVASVGFSFLYEKKVSVCIGAGN